MLFILLPCGIVEISARSAINPYAMDTLLPLSSNSTYTHSKMEIESNSIQNAGTPMSLESGRALKRVHLSNRSITCNDGTHAGYYLRKSLHSKKKWVVFLEGGWHCYDLRSCRARWLRLRHLMTSSLWPESRDGKDCYKIVWQHFINFLFCYFSWRHSFPFG